MASRRKGLRAIVIAVRNRHVLITVNPERSLLPVKVGMGNSGTYAIWGRELFLTSSPPKGTACHSVLARYDRVCGGQS